jgi:Pyridine nucleotide-disulphide oxidoreductase
LDTLANNQERLGQRFVGSSCERLRFLAIQTKYPYGGLSIDISGNVPVVVIVGGGFGGLAAAKALKRTPARVILIDRTNHHFFQSLLYQVATSVLTPGQIASPIRGILGKANEHERIPAAAPTAVPEKHCGCDGPRHFGRLHRQSEL